MCKANNTETDHEAFLELSDIIAGVNERMKHFLETADPDNKFGFLIAVAKRGTNHCGCSTNMDPDEARKLADAAKRGIKT